MNKIKKLNLLGKRYKSHVDQIVNGAPAYMRHPLSEDEAIVIIVNKINEMIETVNKLV